MASKFIHIFYLCIILVLVLIQIYIRLDVPINYRMLTGKWKHISESNTTMFAMNILNPLPGRNTTQQKDSDITHRQSPVKHDYMYLRISKNSKDVFRITLYHPISNIIKRYVTNYDSKKCIYKNCLVDSIYDIGRTPVDADAVIFQGNRMPKIRPVRRDNEQVFVFQTIECPLYVHYTDLGQRSFIDYFNWTMTYRRDSDIPFPYGAVFPKSVNVSFYKRVLEQSDTFVEPNWSDDFQETFSTNADKPDGVNNDTNRRCVGSIHQGGSNNNGTFENHNLSNSDVSGKNSDRENDCLDMEVDNIVQIKSLTANANRNSHTDVQKNYKVIYRQKSRDAAWLVSHCWSSSKRENYVKEMTKYMNVDVYGKCSRMKCPKYNERLCINKVVRNHRFYLAFENSICSDYITEKAYLWFDKDIITVVLGGRNYSHHLPPGTFIDAGAFPSPKTLSEYLLKLGSNEEEYIKVLQRKDQFRVIHENERMQIAYCQLCRMLNNKDKYRKTVHNIKDWWEKKGICVRPMSARFKETARKQHRPS